MMDIDVEKLEAGPILDALIDEQVMGNAGWQLYDYVVINGRRVDVATWLPKWDFISPDRPHAGCFAGQTPPPYSTEIAAAWSILERFGYRYLFYCPSLVKGWECKVDKSEFRDAPYGKPYTYAETAPLAICRAALTATKKEG